MRLLLWGTLSEGKNPWVTYPLWPEGFCCLWPGVGALPAALGLQWHHPQVSWGALGVRLQHEALGL